MKIEQDIAISLAAVIVTVVDDEPRFLRVSARNGDALPFGSFSPSHHRTLEDGLRQWVASQTGIEITFAEQLYTFGSLYRDPETDDPNRRFLTIAYWALTPVTGIAEDYAASWKSWYDFFPWEDYRTGDRRLYDEIRRRLASWAEEGADGAERAGRQERIGANFGPGNWNDERVLPRYELLYEAALVAECSRDWRAWPAGLRSELPISRRVPDGPDLSLDGDAPMVNDHRRILAAAFGRLRSKIKYRPVLFQVLPEEFTLGQLQRVTEAWCGIRLHKQNFRRTLLTGGFVEETGGIDKSGPGRPASFYRFRRDAVRSRRAPWLGLPQKRK